MNTKRNKMICLLFVALMVAVLLSGTALAHSGGTDSEGGHYDSETGEYHYHHGWPAHSHEDTDGDGEPDCPYDFVDATEWHSSTEKSTPTPTEEPRPTDNAERLSGFKTFLTWAAWISAAFLVLLMGFAVIKGRKDKKFYTQLYEGKTRDEIANAPKGYMIGKDELPTSCSAYARAAWGKPSPGATKWGDFSVYVTKSGACYHCKKGCCGAYDEVNAYTVRSHRPCTKCKPQVPDMKWVSEYKEAMEKVRRYNIKLKE